MKRMWCLFLFLSVVLTGVAQRRDLSGVVVDKDNIPIVGAHLIVKGTSQSAVTDRNGRYVLRNVVKGDTIKVTCVGYDPRWKVVSSSTNPNFLLEKRGKQIKIFNVEAITLDWLIRHPMCYLPDKRVSEINLERVGTTSYSDGTYVWNNFKKGDHSFSGELKGDSYFVGYPEQPISISVECSYSKDDSIISGWEYVIYYKDSKTAKKIVKNYMYKELKENGYVKHKYLSETFCGEQGQNAEIFYSEDKEDPGMIFIIVSNR